MSSPPPSAPPVEIRYRMEARLLWRAHWAHLRRFKSVIVYLAVLAIAAIVQLATAPTVDALGVAGLLGGLSVVWLLLVYWSIRRSLQKLGDREVEIRLAADGLDVKTGPSWGHLAWSDVEKVAESRTLYLLYPNRASFHVIPKRHLDAAGRAAVDQWVAWLRTQPRVRSERRRRRIRVVLLLAFVAFLVLVAAYTLVVGPP